jgi:hypothetical protein
MGAHVILDIVPQRIDPEAWADAFEETLRLLSSHPSRLMGYDFRTTAGIRVPVYTRSIELDPSDPERRRWCVAGDRSTVLALPGDCLTMHRDLRHYLGRCRPGFEPPEDMLAHELLHGEPPPTSGRISGDGPASGPQHLAVLGAAMVVESRFPRHAMVGGDIDREQADAARRWVEGVLRRPIALPVRVDAWRLVERLSAHVEGEARVRAADRLYLADPSRKDAMLLRVFGRAEAEPWWLDKLREHPRPDASGALPLAVAYLDAYRDLPRLCGLACLDPRGPKYLPDAFVEALAVIQHAGRERRFDDGALQQTLGAVFGAGAARLSAAFRTRAAGLEAERRAAETPAAAGRAEGRRDDAIPASPSELSAEQQREVQALAFAAIHKRPAASGAQAAAPSSLGLRRAIAAALAQAGPTLTEDAWAWIEREEDHELLGFLGALAALGPRDAATARIARAIFESRELCRFAVAATSRAALAGKIM